MGLATGAPHLGPAHAIGCVAVLLDSFSTQRFVEARPPGAGIEFCLRTEERLPAPGTDVHPRIFRLVVLAGKCRLSARLTHYLELFRREFFLPFGFRLFDLFHGLALVAISF